MLWSATRTVSSQHVLTRRLLVRSSRYQNRPINRRFSALSLSLSTFPNGSTATDHVLPPFQRSNRGSHGTTVAPSSKIPSHTSVRFRSTLPPSPPLSLNGTENAERTVRIETPNGASLVQHLRSVGGTEFHGNNNDGDTERINGSKTWSTTTQTPSSLLDELDDPSIIGTSNSTLDELERIVEKLERDGTIHSSPIASEDRYRGATESTILQSLMTACARFRTACGADLAERILVVSILQGKKLRQQQQRRQGGNGASASSAASSSSSSEEDDDDGINGGSSWGEGPTRAMYTIAMDAWVKSQSAFSSSSSFENNHTQRRWTKGSPHGRRTNNGNEEEEHPDRTASRRAQQILEFMWEEYRASVTDSKQYRDGTGDNDSTTPTPASSTTTESIKPDSIHYAVVLHGLTHANSRDAIHDARELLEEAERLSGLERVLHAYTASSSSPSSSHLNGTNTTSSNSSLSLSDANLVPDRSTYESLVYAYSRYFHCRDDLPSAPPSAVRSKQKQQQRRRWNPTQVLSQSNSILQRMETIAAILNDDDWMPTTKAYNNILHTCGRQFGATAGEEAERVFVETYRRVRSVSRDSMAIKGSVGEGTDGTTIDTNNVNNNNNNNINTSNMFPDCASYVALLRAWGHAASSSYGDQKGENEKEENREPKRCEDILRSLLVANSTGIGTELPPPVVVPSSSNGRGGNRRGVSPPHLYRRLASLPIVPSLSLNVAVFDAVIDSWVKSGSKEAGQRAEDILNYLDSERVVVEEEEEGSVWQGIPPLPQCRGTDGGDTAVQPLRPISKTYGLVVHALSICGNPLRAEHILERQLRNGCSDSSAGTVVRDAMDSVSVAIDAWAKSYAIDRGRRAEALLDRVTEMGSMASLQDDDGLVVRPSEACYANVIAAWESLATTNDAHPHPHTNRVGERAEAALVRMEEEGGYYPSTAVYNRVLSVYAKSPPCDYYYSNAGERTGYARARALLMKMIRDPSVAEPDVYSFHHVVKSCIAVGSEAPPYIRREAFFVAVDAFNALCQRAQSFDGDDSGGDPSVVVAMADDVRPDDQTFILMMKVVQTLLPGAPDNDGEGEHDIYICSPCAERIELCEDLFRTTCESGMLTNATLRIAENILPVGSWKRLEACRTTATSTAAATQPTPTKGEQEEGTKIPLTVYDLPAEWSCRRRQKQNRRRNRKGRKPQW